MSLVELLKSRKLLPLVSVEFPGLVMIGTLFTYQRN